MDHTIRGKFRRAFPDRPVRSANEWQQRLQRLNLFDTYAGMIVPRFADAVGILLMKTAFESVPIELEEAARIDGAGFFTRF